MKIPSEEKDDHTSEINRSSFKHFSKQDNLNVLSQDLDLSKKRIEPFGFSHRKLLMKDAKICVFHNRQEELQDLDSKKKGHRIS